MKTWLLDTGPLVAYLDRGDPDHTTAAAALETFRGRLIVTSAVVVEAMHFVGEDELGPQLLLQFLERSRAEVLECAQLGQLRAAVALMSRYRDTPMDFADATVVLASAGLGVAEVCTLDRRGFRTYRTPQGKAFHLVLDD